MRDARFLFLHCSVFFEELVEQHRVDRFVTHGVSLALFEHSVLDPRTGRIVNSNLAEYHVPVNADIGRLEVAFIDEPDNRFTALGARGIGEIGITGVGGALCNAVYHATGRRIRDLPITLDQVV